MKVIVKNRHKSELTLQIINNVLRALQLPSVDIIEYVKGNGRCVIIDNNNEKIFVIVSRKTADARNAFLAQYISTVLSEFIEDKCTNKRIYISFRYFCQS